MAKPPAKKTAKPQPKAPSKDTKDKGKAAAPSNSGASRRRKAAFEPLYVDAYWFANTSSLDAATAAGLITGFKQGPQSPRVAGERGAARRPSMRRSPGARHPIPADRRRRPSTRCAGR